MGVLPLELDEVSYRAGGRTLLDRVSLAIGEGPRTVILGPNGAGKSLLLRICHGLLGGHEGTVVWKGPHAHAARRRQAMVFQKPLMLRRSVRANVEYGLKLRGLPPAERRARASEALARAGLAGHAEQPARQLSGGEQQRLALARAWALKPDILFLDEPTASLDPGATGAVERIIGEIHQSGAKVVMTTHDLAQARRLADEIIFLHAGRVVERRGAADFFTAPESPEARAYLAGELLW